MFVSNRLTKQIFSAVLSASLLASQAQATTRSGPQAPAATPSGGPEHSITLPAAPVHINADTIRAYLLNSNTSILLQLNSVYGAKETVNRARANLLPSLNVSALLGSLAGGPVSFALTGISILLPFLLPSNWFNLRATQQQLVSSGYSYYIVELNTYASALATYMTVVGDLELKVIFDQRLANMQHIQDIVYHQVLIGTRAQADLDQARSQTQLAGVQVSQVAELVRQEKAAIRHMLGLPIETEIVFDRYHFSAIPEEHSSVSVLVDRVVPVAPEYVQLTALINATRSNRSSEAFSFFNTASLSSSSGGSGSGGGLGNFHGNAGITLSPATLPQIQISNLQISNLEIQQNDVREQSTQVIESTLGSLREANNQVNLASQAQHNAESFYQAVLVRYDLGRATLFDVFNAANSAVDAQSTRARAVSDRDNQRINLNRVLIANQFSSIPSCDLTNVAHHMGNPLGFFSRHQHDTHQSLDQLCRTTENARIAATTGRVQAPSNAAPY